MSYIAATIEREEKMITVLRDLYEQQLADLPKGSLQEKERGRKKYFYLSYRDGGKVVTEYIGNDEETLADLRERLERRKNIENLLKSIKTELRLMSKALEAAR